MRQIQRNLKKSKGFKKTEKPNVQETVEPKRKRNAWFHHAMSVKAENPDISFKDVLKLAKNSYVRP